MIKTRIAAFVLPFLFLATASFAGHSGRHGFATDLPAPVLVYPNEEADTSQENIEFRWRGGFFSGAGYYDLRVYMGTEMVKDNLILKEKVPSRYTSIKIKSALFESGKTYTWSVRIKDGIRQSRSNHSVFKAKNRG